MSERRLTRSRGDALLGGVCSGVGRGRRHAECGKDPLALLPLPIAGLMSDRPLDEVAQAAQELKRAAHALGCSLPDPFMSLSFLALEVIPHLKLTDLGLVDVDQFSIVPLFEGQGDRS